MDDHFNGLNLGLGKLVRLSDAVSRSISAENRTGEKGRGVIPYQDDIISTAFWHQAEPQADFPPEPGLDDMEEI